MKRIVICFLTGLLLLNLAGCHNEKQSFNSPVSFYYLASEMGYGSKDSLIRDETREASGHEEDPQYLLAEYLKGPLEEGYVSPFPANVTLSSLTVENEIARLILSDEIASVSGMELTVACACLTLTVLNLTDAKTVEISAQSQLLNGAPQITMDQNSLLLLDDHAIRPAE